MTSIKISNQLSTTSTTVSNTFIDHYMPPANGEFVKVYLYLIRMASCGQAPTIADMADALSNTESDILRALKYWQKQQLLVLHCNALNDLEFIELLPIKAESTEEPSTFSIISRKSKEGPSTNAAEPSLENSREAEKRVAAVVSMPPKKPSYDMQTLTRAFDSTDLQHLPYEAEILLGKTLSSKDLSTLYYIHDQLDFSADLISYLIEYCVSINKKSFRYMEKVALNWHEHHIQTREEARSITENFSKLNSGVKRALGLTTWGEEAGNYVRLWTTQYGMNQDLIIEACNRSYKRTGGENSLNYASAILENWHKLGITTLEQLEQADAQYRKNHPHKSTIKTTTPVKNAFHNFEQGEDVDYDALLPKVAQPLPAQKEN